MIAIRSEREIALLRQANQIVAEAHCAAKEALAPGVTTREIDKIVEAVIRAADARPAFKGYRGFPAATCISVEDEVVHGIPGDRKLCAGQIVSIDIGACYKGYYGDAATTHCCGAVDAERQHLLDVTDLALSRAIRAARTGNCLNDIGVVIEKTSRDAGFDVVRDFVGHGIGLEMHEEPQILNYDNGSPGPRLKTGMVLAIEPMVTVGSGTVRVLKDGWTVVTRDGKPSAHFEHSVVVREEGGEILSWADTLRWGDRSD